MLALLFILFAGMAIGCAISMVAQRNPLYGAISLIGVFISLACLYVTLAAPFIAASSGDCVCRRHHGAGRIRHHAAERRGRGATAVALALAGPDRHRPGPQFWFAETAFIIFSCTHRPAPPTTNVSDVGLTSSIGAGLFTTYLLPFEITSILLLMAVVGAITLARRGDCCRRMSS